MGEQQAKKSDINVTAVMQGLSTIIIFSFVSAKS